MVKPIMKDVFFLVHALVPRQKVWQTFWSGKSEPATKADLSDYDRIGFASGIYFSKFHQTILKFASENLPENKKVFMICTYGGNAAYKSLEVILKEKKTDIIGKFGCKGYDTFGPFKLVGGIAKGHPDEKDLEAAVSFVAGLQ